ncbi:MAG: DUF3416 domain-containing protein, partial [Cytophagia bacterium]|nr:DUF3416 domain-containing protein [Cytophagia bacterium]
MTKARVIIENVQPQVEGGLYPAKRTVAERIDISAHIFTDGHDHIRAEVLYKAFDEKTWITLELHNQGNDEWSASFYPLKKGEYSFIVQAWIDHFETWYDGFVKKANAKVEVHVELLEGAAFLKRLSTSKNNLEKIAQQLGDEKRYAENIKLVLSDDFAAIVKANPLRENITQTAHTYQIMVEHHKALFSTWYELFPRSASLDGKHGTFKDVVKLLPRIATMG